MRWALLFSLLSASACKEPFDGPAESGDGETGHEGEEESGDTGAEPENLLQNGSFETWVGDDALGWVRLIEGWMPIQNDVADGTTAARLVTQDYGQIEQGVGTQEPIAAGTNLVAAVSARWVEGDATAIFVRVQVDYPDGGEPDVFSDFSPSLDLNGGWVEVSVPVVPTRDDGFFAFSIDVGQGGVPQTVDVDGASLTIVP